MGFCGRLLVVGTTQQTIGIYLYIKHNMYIFINLYTIPNIFINALRFKNNFNRNTIFGTTNHTNYIHMSYEKYGSCLKPHINTVIPLSVKTLIIIFLEKVNN